MGGMARDLCRGYYKVGGSLLRTIDWNGVFGSRMGLGCVTFGVLALIPNPAFWK
jgi:hypothetical protein